MDDFAQGRVWPAETVDRGCPDCGWREADSGWPEGPRCCRWSPGSRWCCASHSGPGPWCWSPTTGPCTGWSPGWSWQRHSRPLCLNCLQSTDSSFSFSYCEIKRKKNITAETRKCLLCLNWEINEATRRPLIIRGAVVGTESWLQEHHQQRETQVQIHDVTSRFVEFFNPVFKNKQTNEVSNNVFVWFFQSKTYKIQNKMTVTSQQEYVVNTFSIASVKCGVLFLHVWNSCVLSVSAGDWWKSLRSILPWQEAEQESCCCFAQRGLYSVWQPEDT